MPRSTATFERGSGMQHTRVVEDDAVARIESQVEASSGRSRVRAKTRSAR